MGRELTKEQREANALEMSAPIVPPPAARALIFNNKLFDLFEDKQAVECIEEYIDWFRAKGMDDEAGRHSFEFFVKEILNPRLRQAPADTKPPETITAEAAATIIDKLMNKKRQVADEIDADFTVSETVSEKARKLERDSEVPAGP